MGIILSIFFGYYSKGKCSDQYHEKGVTYHDEYPCIYCNPVCYRDRKSVV